MEPVFNYDLLVIARQARGLSQGELCSKAGINQSHLSKIENGLINPSEDLIKIFSDILEFPLSYFYQSDRIYGMPLSVHPDPMYRKKCNVKERDLDIINAENNHRIMTILRLMRSVEYKSEAPLPQLDIDQYEGDTAKIADLVRRTWRIPRGPIHNLTEYIERAGVFVIWCDFNDAAIDGMTLSVYNKCIPTSILLNHSQPADRMRFSLAHELGHIIMHNVPNPEFEKQANEFASALLMPAADIKSEFGSRVSLMRLAMLKPIWKVSMQALLMRAKSIGVIDQNQSAYLWRQINARNLRREEPVLFSHELPTVFPKILRIHFDDYKYSAEELAKTLHIFPPYFEQLYRYADPSKKPRKNLRVVP
jgi:Zn-dependent peptidase ImmA (M78 family)/transcriptional regulator with XRE-family HTH domain